jgi:uncharacterized protein YbdZ (MbtH family)
MYGDEKEDNIRYRVVVNHEEQYSIWPEYKKEIPLGWREVGKTGPKEECLAYITEIWTDMRPLSLRNKMAQIEARRGEIEEANRRRAEEAKRSPKDPRDDLVRFLSEGSHPVEASIRPERTVKGFKECIDRGYVHIKFTDTRGGTEIGVRLDRGATDINSADFVNNTGTVHLVGSLTLNYVQVRAIADIDLTTISGHGRLEIRREKTEVAPGTTIEADPPS